VNKSTAYELLNNVMVPHLELAKGLIKMVKSLNSNDPSHRFQIASIIIFLAGIDKTLNLSFELLYLAGRVDWNWMVTSKKSEPPQGVIECQRGLTAKIIKLKELGIDVPYLQNIIDLRNEYIHSCSIYVGYSETLDENEVAIQIKPSGPTISYPLSPMTVLTAKDMNCYADSLVSSLGEFINQTDWQNTWSMLTHKLEQLPKNPEPESTQILNNPENEFEILNILNQRFIGNGAKLLLG
jgi:hypothetical protein